MIPYRDRRQHLLALLHYLHPMLQVQQLNYIVFVVEQVCCHLLLGHFDITVKGTCVIFVCFSFFMCIKNKNCQTSSLICHIQTLLILFNANFNFSLFICHIQTKLIMLNANFKFYEKLCYFLHVSTEIIC